MLKNMAKEGTIIIIIIIIIVINVIIIIIISYLVDHGKVGFTRKALLLPEIRRSSPDFSFSRIDSRDIRDGEGGGGRRG